jgi:hypothetical protein
MQVFYRAPAGCTAEERQGTGQGERQRKRNMGLLFAVIWCAQPPPPYHHLSPILRATSPARGHGYQGWRHSGEPPPPPPIWPYPSGQV